VIGSGAGGSSMQFCNKKEGMLWNGAKSTLTSKRGNQILTKVDTSLIYRNSGWKEISDGS